VPEQGSTRPIAQTLVPTQLGAGLDGFAYGIEQQVDVRGIVYIGLDDEGVSTNVEPVLGAFFYQLVSGPHHDLVDAVEDLGGEQTQVFLERLQAVAGLVGPIAMAEHSADGGVLVGQLQNPIVVGIEPHAQATEHQDLPLRHARPARLGADLAFAIVPLGKHFGEDGEDLLAQLASVT
jgi:hypothetical protein